MDPLTFIENNLSIAKKLNYLKVDIVEITFGPYAVIR